MKLLLLADLHGRVDWYAWAARQNVDAICIAGDLLETFFDEGLLPQILKLQAVMEEPHPPLVLSSGNHDANSGEGLFMPDALESLSEDQKKQSLPFLTGGRWMDAWKCFDCVVDGETRLLETQSGNLVVTTIPHDFTDATNDSGLWQAGALLRKKEACPWLVLHHEPPADTAVGGPMGDPELCLMIDLYRPNFLLSGHHHDQPYRGSFADRVESTWCLNPGMPHPAQVHEVKIPNHILLDLKERKAVWHRTSIGSSKMTSQTLSLS